MTVSATTPLKTFTGDGTTVAFPLDFTFDAAADLTVIEKVLATGAETVKTLTTDYTVAGGSGAVGTVTAVTAPPATVSWTIVRLTAITQETSYPEGEPFPAASHENAMDKLTRIVQEVDAAGASTFRWAATATTFGSPIEFPDLPGDVAMVVPTVTVSGAAGGWIGTGDVAAIAAIVDDVTVVAGIASDVTDAAGIKDDISATAGIKDDISAVAADAADISAVAADAADIGTVAGIAADISTTAGDSADIQTVAANIATITSKANADLSNVTPATGRAALGLDTADSPEFAGLTVPSINGGQLGGSKNVIINGDMAVAQRGTVTGVTNGYGGPDRFKCGLSGGAVATLSQDAESPDGFSQSVKIDITTADASLAAGDYALFWQPVEGLNLQRFLKGTPSAKKFALSFWVRSPKTGTHIVELLDQSNSRQISHAYTVNAANTWEYKSVVLPADTVGAFANSNALALNVHWWLAAGSDYTSGTLNDDAWATLTSANRAAGQVNCVDSTSNAFYLTGVQLTAGAVIEEFEHIEYAEQLRRCQRYYQASRTDTWVGIWSGYCQSGGNYYCTYYLPESLRVENPTIVFTNQTSSGFPATPNNANHSANTITERRTASATGTGHFGSSYTVDAEF